MDVDEVRHQQPFGQFAQRGVRIIALQIGERADSCDPIAANEHGAVVDDAVGRVHRQYEIGGKQNVVHAAPAMATEIFLSCQGSRSIDFGQSSNTQTSIKIDFINYLWYGQKRSQRALILRSFSPRHSAGFFV